MNSWRDVALGTLLERHRRPVVVDPRATYVQIGVRSHGRGVFVKPPVLGTDIGNKRVFDVVEDCLVLNIVFAWEGAVALTRPEHASMIASHRFPMYRVHSDDLMLGFLFAYLRSREGQRALRIASPGGAGRNRTLNQRDFLSIRIPLPSLEEQRTLVWLVERTDTVAAIAGRLHDLHRLLEAELRQQLMCGELRLSDGKPAWSRHAIGDFLKESRVPSANEGLHRKLTVKLHGKGVTGRNDGTRSSERTRYYRRSAGQLIYSKLDFLNGACGVIPRDLDGFESTADLPAFDVSDSIDTQWLALLMATPWFYRRQQRFAVGGRKAKRLSPKELLKILIDVPALPEQQSIRRFLDQLRWRVRAYRLLADLIEEEQAWLIDGFFNGCWKVPSG